MSDTETPQGKGGTPVTSLHTDLAVDNKENDVSDDTRTIDAALAKFSFINGAGSEEAGTACVMTAISWVAGEAWTDHPTCAHRILANLAIRANDDSATTPEQRAELVKAGADGLLDTWWVPTETVLDAISKAPKDTSAFVHALAVVEHIGSWKTQAAKERPNLGDADLTGADLGDADLRDADLRGANLTGADLGDADLRDANLRDADLTGANLGDADLRYADLRYANLGDADLRYADLRYANLTGAYGNSYTRLPAGWTVNEKGLVVPDQVMDAVDAPA